MKQQGIYQIRNLINNKVYIGSSTSIQDRWNDHKSKLRRNKHKNPHLQSSWIKYGEDNFVFEIILYCEEYDLEIYEGKIMKFKNSLDRNYGYNLTEQVDGGRNISKETIEKMSEAQKGNKNCLGRKATEEAKQNMRNAHLGKKLSNETKEKLRQINLGKKMSSEAIQKMILNNKHLGHKKTQEIKEKISKSTSIAIKEWWIKRKLNERNGVPLE